MSKHSSPVRIFPPRTVEWSELPGFHVMRSGFFWEIYVTHEEMSFGRPVDPSERNRFWLRSSAVAASRLLQKSYHDALYFAGAHPEQREDYQKAVKAYQVVCDGPQYPTARIPWTDRK